MTVESWIEEFYPVPAWECTKGQEAKHGLKKWTGTLKENLEKHGCRIDDKTDVTYLTDGIKSKRIFGSTECALCRRFCCRDCPGRVANGYKCAGDLNFHSPWRKALNGDPTELIQWLQKAKEYQDGGSNENEN